MKYRILATTENKYVGLLATSDLFSLFMEDGNEFEITGRIHLGSGKWKFWNETQIFEVITEI